MKRISDKVWYAVGDTSSPGKRPEDPEVPLPGIPKFISRVPAQASGLGTICPDPGNAMAKSRSTNHGGFDNDVNTMNGILEINSGHRSRLPFTSQEMDY